MSVSDKVESGFKKTMPTLTALVVSSVCMLAPVSAYAVVECSTADGLPSTTLQTQLDVNLFQDVYGPCDTMTRTLMLKGGPFSNLDGLSEIVSIDANLHFFQTAVPAASALPNLNNVTGRLIIESTTFGSNPNLSAFPSLTTLGGGLQIISSDHITSLSGMTSLINLGAIFLGEVKFLTSLTGLPAGLDMIKLLYFYDNDNLQTLEGLSPVNGVRNLDVVDNPVLTSISALEGSTFDDSYGFPPVDNPEFIVGLYMDLNPMLVNLTGIPSVPPVSVEVESILVDTAVLVGRLRITRHPLITNLSVLDGLVEMWGKVEIFDNYALSDCSALSTVFDTVDDGFVGPNQNTPDPEVYPPDLISQFDGMYVGFNAEGCNSTAEIVASGSNEGVFMDGFETKITN
jgi:hypothetical protein